MKKFLIVLVLMFAATCLFADCWTDYKEARAAAIAAQTSGDYATASDLYLVAEKTALVLVNFDGTVYGNAQAIADWQRNNAAYMLILDYAKTPEKIKLEKALALLTERVITTAAAEKVNTNIAYCKEQLK